MKRGERKDGSVVEHCGVRIASKWRYCPMCGMKKHVEGDSMSEDKLLVRIETDEYVYEEWELND
jgi:hypothetical protein